VLSTHTHTHKHTNTNTHIYSIGNVLCSGKHFAESATRHHTDANFLFLRALAKVQPLACTAADEQKVRVKTVRKQTVEMERKRVDRGSRWRQVDIRGHVQTSLMKNNSADTHINVTLHGHTYGQTGFRIARQTPWRFPQIQRGSGLCMFGGTTSQAARKGLTCTGETAIERRREYERASE